MASAIQAWKSCNEVQVAAPAPDNWFALQTRARHEKMVSQRLQERGVSVFLPLVSEVHSWSDRKKVVEVPLFGCYVFARIAGTKADRLRVLRVDGVLNLVGSSNEGTPIPDEQITVVRTLLQGKVPLSSHPFLKVGQRIRIRTGALSGMEGVLLSQNGNRTMVISVDAIQRSLAVRVEGYEIEAA